MPGSAPRDAAGKVPRRVAAELVGDLERTYERKKAADKELRELVRGTGTGLLDLNGIGPSGAARLLVEMGYITRFPNRAHLASWTGTAFIDASSIVYRTMLDDAVTTEGTGPGGHRGTTAYSSAAGSHPHTDTSDQSLPGPAH
nr:transposase [uncultured Actinotalea sp.]